jgi:hypothetical protein
MARAASKTLFKQSAAEIRALQSAEDVQDAIDILSRDIERIRAQIEFPTEEQTVDWEIKAKRALTFKRVLLRVANQRHDELVKNPVKLAAAQAAEAKRLLKARRAEMHAENVRDKAIRRAEHLERERLANEKRFSALFAKFARSFLTADQIAECERLAREAGTDAGRQALKGQ